jgi:RNA recognition motif-containing protein
MIAKSFQEIGNISDIRLPTNYGTDTAKGYAYVEYSAVEDADKALQLDKTLLGGRKILVTRCHTDKNVREQIGFTIYVKNISFEVSEQDLEEYFGKTCGEVKQVKLIKDDATGKSKGFGYVEFQKEEAL